MNSVVMVGGERTLPKDVAFHPVTDRPVHVDFLRIGEHATRHRRGAGRVHRRRRVRPASSQGGVLNIVRHELELVVDAADIPSEITISLKGREVGDSIHISRRDAAARARSRRSTTATSRSPRSCRRRCRPPPDEAEPTPRPTRSRRAAGRARPTRHEARADRAEAMRRRPSTTRRRASTPVAADAPVAPSQPAGARRRAPCPFAGRGDDDADLGRARQSGRAICDAPAQCRLHGGRRDRRGPRLRRRSGSSSRAGRRRAGSARRRCCCSSPRPS